MMDILRDVNPDVFEFVPPSFCFPGEDDQWREYAKKNPKATFIAKP